MWRNIKDGAEYNRGRYYNSERHTIEVPYLAYMDEVAAEMGCKPNLGTYGTFVSIAIFNIHSITVRSRCHAGRAGFLVAYRNTLSAANQKSP